MSENTPAETPVEEAPAPEEKPKKKASKSKAEKPKHERREPELLLIDTSSKEWSKVRLPDENDTHWDAKMRNPVPEHLVEGLAEYGWDRSMAAVAIRQPDGGLLISHGKTRARAVEKANRLRKAHGWGNPIVAAILAVDEDPGNDEQILYNMIRNARLNSHQQFVDPMTKAENITRLLSAGVDERTVAKAESVSVEQLHGYLLITDDSKCPPAVQELLREGKLSFAAALELARKADKMTASEVSKAAEQISKMAEGNVRVTSAQVQRAANVHGDLTSATQKEKRTLVLKLKTADLRGAHGEAAKWAALVALEVGLGTRTIDQFWESIDKIAKGKTVRLDFKQYESGDEKVVKGQEKK